MYIKKNLILAFVLFLSACQPTDQKQPTDTKKHEYIKSVHYFADAWPKTFWQEFEEEQVEGDLQRIKVDGFNTVVLTVSWMGFENIFKAAETQSDARMYNRLDFMLEAITQQGLQYILRVGYPHDFTPNMDTDYVQLCLGLYGDEKVMQQWLAYLDNVKQITNRYQAGLSGILISWEDHWCPHFVFPFLPAERRIELSQQLGYGQWMEKQDRELVKVLMGENQLDFNAMPLPHKDEPVYYLYLRFVDELLEQRILNSTKTIFPSAAMEIRVDKDPVNSHKGKIWVEHDLFFDEPNHRGTYWAPFWGARNEGERLSLEQVLKNFEYFLRYVSDDGRSINHVIEQFNFTDNTPYFPNNALIEDGSVIPFLKASVPLLKKYSVGYGLWSYQDYVDNALYNASFEFGLDGWQVTDNVSVKNVGEDQQLHMPSGARIAQRYAPAKRFMLSRSYETLTLCVWAEAAGTIEVSENGAALTQITLQPGLNCESFNANALMHAVDVEFVVTALSDLVIDELKLFGFVQYLGVYDEDGNPGPYLQAIRDMNRALSQ
ncbi:hypothetical protein [Marinicella sp. W31]|uniref:hypothetical protein n=1 Tax=Marinicella sp. W31 TaxID=3023713 RepID=UPI003757FF65